jgi:hypothetical protein
MPRRNRVDPFGDLHAVADRGLFTGNRGCLVDGGGTLVRHHRGSLWITCLTEFREMHHPLAAPGTWTPLFFLDDAVALAAGHRPCGLCRRSDYESYRDAVMRGTGSKTSPTAADLNARLATERLGHGRGLNRGSDRKTWESPIGSLPDGTVIVGSDLRGPQLLFGGRVSTFVFSGWADASPRPQRGSVTVLTPPTSVVALANGFVPTVHPTATQGQV